VSGRVVPSSYQKLFDKLAPHYRIIDFLSLGSTRYLRKCAIKDLGNCQGTVVDMLCGTGNNIAALLAQGMGIYIGLDSSMEMMYHTKAKYLQSGDISFVQCNVLHDLPATLKADHIICTYGLKCFTAAEYPAFADSINAILKPGANFSLVEFRMPFNPVFRFLTSIYVNVFCGLVCLLVTGSLAPTRSLVNSMTPAIDPELMKKLLEERGLSVTMREKNLLSAVFLYGRKPGIYE
jgi:ubiquinone/menaquinone biosynthesis C-methylase UbiE